ncbi:hypothetical protein C2845_PM04G27010 [Panicum miliaceum]|uniref:Alpha/beta hydrolase fold-3 domain-containing protein n=1 Tax=Panicum miliaceum TaxID=4540 RepID=A0A3L6QPK4_PANMI|nr:hypothetical protein C2845_PM04G27010 [Panicum miliaceum]
MYKPAAGGIVAQIPGALRIYKDGPIERLLLSPFVPACENPDAAGVAMRDVVIDRGTGVGARLFLSTAGAAATTGWRRLPLVVYFHGGTFTAESAFCRRYHRYATSLAARAGALVVSVEYRLAPEHPIPAAYDDAWAALRWVASSSDPWLADRADPWRVFLAGDSAGGDIAFHTAVRAGRDREGTGGGDVEGLVLVHPYFWGPDRLPSELAAESFLTAEAADRHWALVTGGRAGNDDPWINPSDEDVAFASLTCRRALVAVAEKDLVRERVRRLAARYRGCGGDVTLVESAGEDHGFHLSGPPRARSIELLDHIVKFINKEGSRGRGQSYRRRRQK